MATEAKTAAKRPKTGGRPAKKGIDELVAEAVARGKLSLLPDDTTLPEVLASLYLCISPAQLADLRKPGPGGEPQGPEFVKHIQPGAQGQNQPILYKLGALREWEKKDKASTSFDAAVNSGMLGFVSREMPFFAQPVPPRKRGRPLLLSPAWDLSSPKREERFLAAMAGELIVVWSTAADAAGSRWDDLEAHSSLADRYLELLRDESASVAAAVLATEFSASTAAGEPTTGATR